MNFEMIQNLFDSAKNIDKIKQQIKDFVKNPENPWEQREYVWEKCPRAFLPQELFLIDWHFTDGEEVSWYDDFHTERHEIVDCRELKNYSRFAEDNDEWQAFKKHCIDKGIFSFEFDW